MISEAAAGKLTRKQAKRQAGQQTAVTRRSVFRLGEVSLTVACPQQPALDQLIDVCKAMIRECRKAAREGLDVSTFERVLADRQRSAVAIPAEERTES